MSKDTDYYMGWPIKDELERIAMIDDYEAVEKALNALAREQHLGIEEFQRNLINSPKEVVDQALPLLAKKVVLLSEMESWLKPSNKHTCGNNVHMFKEGATPEDRCSCGQLTYERQDKVVDLKEYKMKRGLK